MSTPNRHLKWRKATYSAQSNGCVEVANTLDRMRDSKNPAGPVLAVDLRVFLTEVKADRFTG